MSLQKNVKSHVFWILKKKRKNVFSNYALIYVLARSGGGVSPLEVL